MNLARKPYAYSKMDMEDPEETEHRRAQFLIYKVLEQSDSRRRRSSFLRIRLCRLKVKIGKRLKKMRKSMLLCISAANIGVYKQVISQLKTWKHLFCSGHGQTAIVSLPPKLIVN